MHRDPWRTNRTGWEAWFTEWGRWRVPPGKTGAKNQRIGHGGPLDEGSHGAKGPAVGFLVERGVEQELDGLESGVLIEQHGPENRLFGLRAPRSLTLRAWFSARQRGGVVRYERHPRSASSNSGCEAAPPGGR